MHICSKYFKSIFEIKNFSLNSSRWDGLLRPYRHYVLGREGGRPCRHAWLVCLSERHHDDRRPVMLEEHSLFPPSVFSHFFGKNITSIFEK